MGLLDATEAPLAHNIECGSSEMDPDLESGLESLHSCKIEAVSES